MTTLRNIAKMRLSNNLILRICTLCVLTPTSHSAPSLSSDRDKMLVLSTSDIPATTIVSSAESWESSDNDNNVDNHGPVSTTTTTFPPPVINLKPMKPEIYSFRIQSDIKYRYSRTYVTSRVVNRDPKNSHEYTFNVVLRETAFISKFTMEIDGKVYEAYVKEKEEAKRVYTTAQSQGHTAGLVEMSTRNSNTFNVNINIKAQSKVTFNLTYEELLSRRLGKYEQTINISPEQITSVKDFQILVNIEESQNITFLRVPNLRNDVETESDADGNNQNVVIHKDGNKANISWTPSVAEQEKLAQQGLGGKFIVQYDINRDSTSGEVLVMEGYFVHFFSPESLPPLRKHVVFVLDISGSMWGRKMEQLKESQMKILDDLNADDFFNIITFNGDVLIWSPSDPIIKQMSYHWSRPYTPEVPLDLYSKQQPYPATRSNIDKAKQFIDSLSASGGTNIHDSIKEAINLTSVIKNERDGLPQTNKQIPNENADNPVLEPLAMMDVVMSQEFSAEVTTQEIPTTRTPVTAQSEKGNRKNILPKNVESLIIFLTDGEPTVGVTDPPYIQELIQTANKNLKLPIFTLGFGEGADFPFLRKLSLQNYGFARKIYEASDAALQLTGFYNEIASPLLANVIFNYTSPEYNVTDVTVATFPTVFGGTEIAIAGKIKRIPTDAVFDEVDRTDAPEISTVVASNSSAESVINSDDLVLTDAPLFDVGITGSGRNGSVDFKPPHFFCRPIDFDWIAPFPPRPTPPPSEDDRFLERLWAYLTIQQLIEKDLKEGSGKINAHAAEASTELPNTTLKHPSSDSQALPHSITTKTQTPKEQAVKLALKYSFVTPLTSLVVVKPNSSEITNAVPTDAATDAPDSISAPQSMFAMAYLPQPLLANKMGASGTPLLSPSGAQMQSQSISSINRVGSSHYPGIGIPGPPPLLMQTQYRPTPTRVYYTTTYRPRTSTSSTTLSLEEDFVTLAPTERNQESSLGLNSITWYNSSSPSLQVNGDDYQIYTNATSSGFVGSDCLRSWESVSSAKIGSCVHLKDCVQPAFISDITVFKQNYFCPIKSGNQNFVGVCCPSLIHSPTPTPTMP